MDVKPTLSELLEEHHTLFRGNNSMVSAEMENRKAIWIESMRCMTRTGNRSYCLLNLNTGMFEVRYSAYSDILFQMIVHPSCPDSWKNMNQHCPSKDLYHNLETDILFYRLLMSLPGDKRKDFVMICLRRFKNKKLKNNIYIIRASVVECDAINTPWLVMIEMELLTGYKTEKFQPKRQFLLNTKEQDQIGATLEKHNMNNLTGQEMTILKIASTGQTAPEIAEVLSLSVHTIKSHLSQIMDKLNAPNIKLACLLAQSLRMI